jgi:CelD/BcsL family acetyltransferase involved in cellulose biosynthesis
MPGAPEAVRTRLAPLELTDSRWRYFVDRHPQSGPFHHPAWAQMVADCYQMRPFALVQFDGAARVCAGAPVVEVGRRRKRWVSLPFTDYCPPLAEDDAAAFAWAEALETVRVEHDLAAIELRADAERGYPVAAGYRHVLELADDPEQVLAILHDSTARNIRKATRVGLEVTHASAERELSEEFYRLHLMVRRRHGVPIQPRRFFVMFWERVVELGLAEVLIVRSGGAPIAGVVVMSWNRHAVYKFGAADPAYARQRPSNLALWEAISRCCIAGDRTFDFGRTDEDDDGLRTFKKRFGGAELPLTYTAIGDPPGGRAGLASAALGPVLRHSPAWVTRAAGELLYKYAA